MCCKFTWIVCISFDCFFIVVSVTSQYAEQYGSVGKPEGIEGSEPVEGEPVEGEPVDGEPVEGRQKGRGRKRKPPLILVKPPLNENQGKFLNSLTYVFRKLRFSQKSEWFSG